MSWVCNNSQGDIASCLSFFDKMVDIWYKFLQSVRLGTLPMTTPEASLKEVSLCLAVVAHNHFIVLEW